MGEFSEAPMNGKAVTTLTMSIAALALAACGELPQDGPKPFVSKDEMRSHAGDVTLAERAKTQDEYLVTKDAKK